MLQKLFAYFVICWCCLFGWNNTVTAQTDSELEDAVESLEKLAEELGGSLEDGAEEIGEALEEMIDEHSEELQEWSEKYSGQWEDWMESFEERFNDWAEDQERVWEKWAERYGSRLESWAEELEDGEWDPENIGNIVQRNLEMFGKMPLGKLVEDMLTEGTESFESAPWESLDELQGVVKNSLATAAKETERRLAEAKRNRARSGKRNKEVEVDYILPMAEGQQDELKTQTDELADLLQEKIDVLKQRLTANDLEEDEMKALFQQLLMLSKKKKTLAKNSAEKRKRDREQIRERAIEARKQAIEVQKNARMKANQRLADSVEKAKDSRVESAGDRKMIEKMYRAFGEEQKKLDQKKSELEELRNEIRQLRDEVRKMQKKQDDRD